MLRITVLHVWISLFSADHGFSSLSPLSSLSLFLNIQQLHHSSSHTELDALYDKMEHVTLTDVLYGEFWVL